MKRRQKKDQTVRRCWRDEDAVVFEVKDGSVDVLEFGRKTGRFWIPLVFEVFVCEDFGQVDQIHAVSKGRREILNLDSSL